MALTQVSALAIGPDTGRLSGLLANGSVAMSVSVLTSMDLNMLKLNTCPSDPDQI